MKIYVVRHGADEEGYRGGWSQRGLTETGVNQSKMLGKYLHEHAGQYDIQTIISSDLQRAVQTSKEIEAALNIPGSHTSDWREMNNGELAGMLHAEAEEKYPGIYFNTLEMHTAFPGGESPIHFYTRIKSAFQNLCTQLEAKKMKSNVLLVTHGGVINILYYVLLNQEWSNTSSFYTIHNTSIHTFGKMKDSWSVLDTNREVGK
ncbi:histidine phosphatase family protein [Paenibacillus barcinonensis]|uniref:Histidine phosphatase family protein n=1 Tax=Paenibacillus barcinonensis TaxID=198119 RepID=A0A2V4W0E2_PAEBA|nr:histidine phosphatase family protein [Paenibacillus barcinonensis]PYE47820.1 putative phosphoglycerate mutase [Paenibacillus barcinonensis]QKS59079.1 histidine phosphatase family protein [Paenibacillus barcinonensis]